MSSENHDCTQCGREFGTLRGMRTHRSKMHQEWLRETIRDMYVDEMMVPEEIGEELDMSRQSVTYWTRKFNFQQPAKFHLEGHVLNGPDVGYPRWTYTGTGHRVRVHRLQMIANGADPHKVFSGEWTVDHINGCPLDNRMENLQLLSIDEHGQKDGHKGEVGHSHKEYLEALVQTPPDWAQKVCDSPEY